MMARFRTRALAAFLIFAACADPIFAQAPAVSYEFRGATRGRQGYVSHIWKLLADGRVTGISTERRGGGLGGYSIDLSDTGRWQIRQRQICFEWSGSFQPLNGCYGLERRQGNHVVLNGPSAFEGVFDPVPVLQ